MNKYIIKERRLFKDRRNFNIRMRLLQKYLELEHLDIDNISKELNVSVDVVKRLSVEFDENS